MGAQNETERLDGSDASGGTGSTDARRATLVDETERALDHIAASLEGKVLNFAEAIQAIRKAVKTHLEASRAIDQGQ